MGLFEKGFAEKGTGESLPGGFYVNEISITSASDVSGEEYQLPNGTILFANDLAVKINYRNLGSDKEFSTRIGGNFKVDEQTKEVIGAGGAFKVERLFEAVGYEEQVLDDNSNLREEALRALEGKNIATLSYPNTAGKTTMSDIVGKSGSGEQLRTDFMLSKWKPKNYLPKLETPTVNNTIPANSPF